MPVKTENEFIATSNYPQKEYIKFLEYKKSALVKASTNRAFVEWNKTNEYLIEKINEEIRNISSESFRYNIMDMIYAGEKDLAQKACSEDVFESCILHLNNLSGKEKEIYAAFANQFIMPEHVNGQQKTYIVI